MAERITHEEYTQWLEDNTEEFVEELEQYEGSVHPREVFRRGFIDAMVTLEFYGRIYIEKPVKRK